LRGRGTRVQRLRQRKEAGTVTVPASEALG
jgi:hypothetical protein